MRGKIKWIVLVALGAAYLAVAISYLRSSEVLSRQYPALERSLPVSTNPEVLARGEELAMLYGCYRGCHGPAMQGSVVEEGMLVGRIVAPNLTASIRNHSLTTIEAMVRQGVRPDGTSLFHMPSAGYAVMTDEDFTAITSFIRAYPLQVDRQPAGKFGLSSRLALLTGDLRPQATQVRDAPWHDGYQSEPRRLGEYLVRNACVECHGLDPLRDRGDVTALVRAQDYDRWEFVGFVRSGMALGDKVLGRKTEMMKSRFGSLTEKEIEAIYAYLSSL
ncbi:cytochrome c [Marinihelvus fidelis]|uniref:cytochrome c n=1 Tax=Marinihelvus fidelis TaxID=2613842 RepID=UPI001786CBAE|nr:cytochrome c [Marinihelvus fidelis]